MRIACESLRCKIYQGEMPPEAVRGHKCLQEFAAGVIVSVRTFVSTPLTTAPSPMTSIAQRSPPHSTHTPTNDPYPLQRLGELQSFTKGSGKSE